MTGSADLSRLRQAEIEALRKRIQEVEKENSNILEELDLVDAENHALYKRVQELEKENFKILEQLDFLNKEKEKLQIENKQLKKTIYDLQRKNKKHRS